MPRIFDNIELPLLKALQDTLNLSYRADFCVGYFNLRGWKLIDSYIDRWVGGDVSHCRLLIGMNTPPQEQLRAALSILNPESEIDNQQAARIRRQIAEEFREQLLRGAPTNQDEIGLRKLSAQLKEKKLMVKLFLRHPLHAKLYLLHRNDPINPTIGFLGSSNLTLAGLSKQGELNIDVLEHDASNKLQKWFNNRWNDTRCVDVSQELIDVIDNSWARDQLIPPYHIYLKMAYHMSQEARAGLAEFKIPREFGNRLFDFQKAAVKIAAHYINKRSGVMIGDVVGLGKTLMATALAKILQEDQFTETLIICPKNLVTMWENYRDQYRLLARVLPISKVMTELPELRRYKVVLIDESHNLRNREGKRFKMIQQYIETNESLCILLSATPYNKTYLDLSSQLRLFVPEDEDLGLRPEQIIRELGETEFIRRHQCPIRSLAAFEKSPYADDWRDLMRLFLVRRTRSFIRQNYAQRDAKGEYLLFEDGTKSYFPARQPKTIKLTIDDSNKDDPYAKLYSNRVVNAVNALHLPRYGLANYIAPTHEHPPTTPETHILTGLSRAGGRIIGFCRTNLFKRLESGGTAFIQSIERHVLRNFVYLHAIEKNLPLPIGTQGAEYLDLEEYDLDPEASIPTSTDDDEVEQESTAPVLKPTVLSEADFQKHAAEVYAAYATQHKSRFKWLRPTLFIEALHHDLLEDAQALIEVLKHCGVWDPTKDTKLNELIALITKRHPHDKILIFTQFADTVDYLATQFKLKGIQKFAPITGETEDPTVLTWHFSPESNEKCNSVKPEDELRVLIATDVLSEGQNLQDCFIVVNYDLPWAIIRLIQRAGRLDRIGQKADTIFCYSFLPADGVERIIRLRARVRDRLQENAEVIGTDESFFEDQINEQPLLDLYHEKTTILDTDADGEVDLASYAYQIWKNALDRDPALEKTISQLADVSYSARAHTATANNPEGVLVYVRTPEGNDALSWVDETGHNVTESQLKILQMADCPPNTPAIPRSDQHHELVQTSVQQILSEEKIVGGQLGRPSGARFKTYERLKRYQDQVKGTDQDRPELLKAIDEIYKYPLRQTAIDTLNRQLRTGITDVLLAELVYALRSEDRLCIIQEEQQTHEPRIICSLGLTHRQGENNAD